MRQDGRQFSFGESRQVPRAVPSASFPAELSVQPVDVFGQIVVVLIEPVVDLVVVT